MAIERRFACVAISLAWFCLAIASPSPALSEQLQDLKHEIATELQISDPEVKSYVDAAEGAVSEGKDLAPVPQLQKALELCDKKGLISDKAVVEAKLAATYLSQGGLDQAKRYLEDSLSGAITVSNLALQADDLVALASLSQVSGGTSEALDLLKRALDLARSSKSSYMQSRVLGELGRIQLALGNREEAARSIEEALQIDRENKFPLEANHLIYRVWIAQSNSASNLDEAIRDATEARTLAIEAENFIAFVQASTTLAQALSGKGRIDEAVAMLEHSRAGVSEQNQPLFEHAAAFRSIAAAPFFRFAFLESLAQIYEAHRRTDEALKTWTDIYEAAKVSGFSAALTEAAHHQQLLYSNLAVQLADAGDYSGALVDGEKALSLAEAARDPIAKANSYILLSQIHTRRSEGPDAVTCARWAVDLYKELKMPVLELEAEIALADAMRLTEPGKGLALYQHAYTVGKEFNAIDVVTRALTGLALLAGFQGDMTTALARFREEREIFQSRNSRRDIALVEHGIGTMLMNDNPKEALPHFLEEAKIGEELGVYSAQITGTLLAAELNLALANLEDTDKLFSKALDLARQHGNPQDLINVLLSNTNAVLHQRTSRPVLGDLTEARDIARKNHLASLEMRALNEISQFWKAAGDYDRSLGALLEALKLADTLELATDKVMITLKMCELYTEAGDNRLAQTYASQAVALSREAKNPSLQSIALGQLAAIHREARDFNEALRLELEGLEVSRAGGPSAEAFEHSELALDYQLLGDHQRELTHALESLRLNEQIGSQPTLAIALDEVAIAYTYIGQTQRAIEYHDRAYELALRLRRWDEVSTIAVARAYLYVQIGDLLKAKQSTEEALAVLSFDQRRSITLYKVLATVEGLRHNWKPALAAISHYQDVVTPWGIARDVYDAHKIKGWVLTASGETALGYSELKEADVALDTLWNYSLKQKGPSAFFEDKLDSYVELVRAAYKLYSQDSNPQFAQDAFILSEKSHARNLANVFAQSQLDALSTLVPRDVLTSGRKLDASLDNAREEYLRALVSNGQSLVDAKKAEYEKQVLAQRDFIADVRKRYPAYAGARYPQPTQPSTVVLNNSELLIEFFATDEEIFRWVLAAQHGTTVITSFERIPVKGTELIANVGTLLDAIQNLKDATRVSSELYRLLFKSCEREVSGAHTLWIVASGVLEFVPFEVLNDDSVPSSSIVDHYNVNYLPSASLLGGIKRPREDSRASSIFLMGDPSFPKPSAASHLDLLTNVAQASRGRGWTLDPLPATREEVAGIAQLFRERGLSATTLLGPAAKRTTLQASDLSKYRFIHFATHAISTDDLPYLSKPSLILSFDQNSEDAFFTLDDILGLRLNAELAVLSACSTATGKYLAGEGPAALSRAFMYAGARAVVASLWPVADQSTAIFMHDFYSFLLQGESHSEALRHAKLELRKKGFQSPYFWAPFILIGH